MVTVSQFPKHDVTPPPQKTIFHNEDIGDLGKLPPKKNGKMWEF